MSRNYKPVSAIAEILRRGRSAVVGEKSRLAGLTQPQRHAAVPISRMQKCDGQRFAPRLVLACPRR